MRKYGVKVLSCVLSLALIVLFVFPSNTNAESMIVDNGFVNLEENLNIKYTGENSWEYVEKRDGEVYKVIEEINSDTNEIISIVKKQNYNGEFILYKKYISTPIEDGLEIKTINNGEEKVDQVEWKRTDIQFDQNFSENENLINPLALDLTPWKYSYTSYNNVNFTAITVGIVSAALAAYFKLPAKSSFIFGSAVTIVSAAIPTVYTKQIRYYKNIKGTTILAGIKDYNYVYKYSNYTGLLKSGTETQVIDR